MTELIRTKLFVLFVILAAVSVSNLASAHAAFPGKNGRIIYDGIDGYLHTVGNDGTGDKRLVIGEGARWSPDGKRIAYARAVNGQYDVYTTKADGTGGVRVTTAASDEARPAWSPDGHRLVFVSDRNGYDEILVINSTKPFGTPVSIAHGDAYVWLNDAPEWSPDGSKILLVRYDPSDGKHVGTIMTVSPDGSNAADVYHTDNYPVSTSWGPGGKRIAFTTGELQQHYADVIWTIPSSGVGALVRVSQDTGTGDRDYFNELGAWSPDGRLLVYEHYENYSDENGDPQETSRVLYVQASNGQDTRRLLVTNGSRPDWQRA